MKILFFPLLIIQTCLAFGQDTDTITAFPPRYNTIIVKDNIGVKISGVVPSNVESKIMELEARECKALLARDLTALSNLWVRDFTSNQPQKELVVDKNPIPFYVVMTRMIEKTTVLDNTVITSGEETSQLLNANGSLGEIIVRKFSHTWVFQHDAWKLMLKH